MPIAWLSVMLTGAIFVPVDTSWPEDRFRHAVELTRSSVLLVTKQISLVGLPDLHFLEIVMSGQSLPDSNPSVKIDGYAAGQLMYGFFTSGSTGTPKCALNHHAGVANRLQYMTKIFGRGNVVLQNSSHLFDSSIWQLLWPLASDGTVVIDPTHRVADIHQTVALIEKYGVTMTDFVPSIFRLLVQAIKRGEADKERLKSVKHLLIGGEEIDPEVVRDFQRLLPHIGLVNTYGHTEASIGMVFHLIPQGVSGRIALGHPIDNTYVRICCDDLCESPAGDIGEIVVGGVCVGSGYLGRDDLTAKAFIANPFMDVPGSRVYRTGDMGRINEHGMLEYHGRRDTQIKVRGVRLEMEEIEYVVNHAFDGEITAYAVPLMSVLGEQHVGLAYVALDIFDISLLRSRLSRELPATHMPKVFLRLDEVPLTPNGKADRHSISQRFSPILNASVIRSNEVTLEGSLLNIYKKLFPGQSVDLDTNFFDCGGDSVDSVNFVMEVENELGLSMTVSCLYDLQTPRRLAGWLANPSVLSSGDMETLPQYTGPRLDYSRLQVHAEHVLLTGACGFVGAHVLRALIDQTNAFISVIVRAANQSDANCRIYETLSSMSLSNELVGSRVYVYQGDISQPKLGCSENTWNVLAEQIDTIFHLAAEVNFLQSYEQLRKSNVTSTEELLRLCCEKKAKRIHYVSSAVAKGGDELKSLLKDQLSMQALSEAGLNGYAISKIASENILTGAAESGVAVSIYRLGEVMPVASQGSPNHKSMIYRFFQVCQKQCIAPLNIGSINALSVHDAAQSLVREIINPFLFAFRSKSLKLTTLGSESIYNVDRLFEEIEAITGVGHRFYEYSQFLQELERLGDTDSRLLISVLPRPGVTNDIFGTSLDTHQEVDARAYAEMAAGLIGVTVDQQRINEDSKHGISA